MQTPKALSDRKSVKPEILDDPGASVDYLNWYIGKFFTAKERRQHVLVADQAYSRLSHAFACSSRYTRESRSEAHR